MSINVGLFGGGGMGDAIGWPALMRFAALKVESGGGVSGDAKRMVRPSRHRRRLGAPLRGGIRIADDFDALPPKALAAMEAEEGTEPLPASVPRSDGTPPRSASPPLP